MTLLLLKKQIETQKVLKKVIAENHTLSNRNSLILKGKK